MKKIAIFLLTLSFVIQNTNAQSYEPQDKMGFILSAGYKHLSLKSSTHNALAFDISLHNHFNNIDFNSGFYWDKDYMSFDPFALFGIMCFYFVKYGEGGFLDGDNNVGLLIGATAFSSMNFNIKIGKYFKIRPYWSMLRLSKIKNITDKFTLNAGIGTFLSAEINRIMINPYCEYSFGYKKESPFTGFNYGISLGVKLYD